MNIEDLITILHHGNSAPLNNWDRNLLSSITLQLYEKNSITEKQGMACLKIVKRHQTYLEQKIGRSLSNDLQNPKWKTPFRVISNQKIIKIQDDSIYSRVLKIEFPYHEEIVSNFRKHRDVGTQVYWDKEKSGWFCPLQEETLALAHEISEKYDFEIEDDVRILFDQVKKIQANLEKHVPLLSYENNDLKFVNLPENCPVLESKNVISALFEARKKGIFTWDENINQYLTSDEQLTITHQFLSNPCEKDFHINSEKIDIFEIRHIVLNLLPAIFIVPGGSELEKLSMAYDFLSEIGIESRDISVMFRLPTETDKDFNDFVKNNNLNSPLSDETKIVFLCSKLPKPVLKYKKKFNLAVHLGHSNVHYTVRNFAKNHENMIYYSEKKDQRTLDFGNL